MIRFAKTFALLLSALSCIPAALAQTPGSVAFNTTLVSVSGKWGTKHYVVAWVTKEDGTFIKTLWKQGKSSFTDGEWSKNCPSWSTARAGSTSLDGYTSATASDYSTPVNNPIDPVWNCQDAAGALVPDGNYKFWVQYGHSDAAGPVTTNGLLWTKRSTAFSNTYTNTSSFTGMSIAWTPAAAPEIAVEQPAGTNLTDGSASINCGSINVGSSSSAITFTVKNTGTGPLTLTNPLTKDGTNAADFTVSSIATSVAAGGSTAFTVTFAPSAAGSRTAAIHLASNDANETPFDINLTGTGVAVPEIAIEQPVGTNLTDGSATVNVGTVNLGGSSSPLTFTVKSLGSAPLTSLGLTKDGSHAADFTLSTVATSVAAGGSTTFTVTFTPSAAGTRTAAIHLASNDANESPFDINLTGVGGAVPEIAVEQPVGTNLTDGTASISCGSSTLGNPTSVVTVTIKNPGTADLTGLAITKDGTHAADFAVSSLTATSLAPAASLTFTVTFTPSAAGSRLAAIHLASNDADENPFDLNLTGTGLVPEIFTPGTATLAVTLGPISGGEYWWAAWVTKDDGTFIKTLHLRGNSGEGAWDPHWNAHCATWYAARNGSTALDGYTAATATTYAPPDNPLALAWNGRDAANNLVPDGTYKLWVQYSEDDESASGPVTTNGLTLLKGTSVSTTNPPAQGTSFTNLSVAWTPAVPAIGVEQPVGTGLVNHSSTIDFGTSLTGAAVAKTFTIKNTGTAELTGIAATPDGTHHADFVVTTPPTSTIAAGGSTTFAVTFTPSAASARVAALHISSNDPAHNPFDLNLTGTGNTAPVFAGYSCATPYQTPAGVYLSKLLAKATDADGDPLTVALPGPTSARGGTVVLQGDAILYTPAAGVSGADTFPVTLTDARGAATPGTVTVTVGPSPAAGGLTSNPPKLTVLPGGSIGLRFQGIPGQLYQIQRSTDMAVWTTLGSVTANAVGTLTFTDENPPQPNGYYRLGLP